MRFSIIYFIIVLCSLFILQSTLPDYIYVSYVSGKLFKCAYMKLKQYIEDFNEFIYISFKYL